jgi:rhodanese-related sulfurtransferase
MENKYWSIFIGVIAFFIGVLLVLSFRFLKYTEYINPKIVDIDPLLAYENIKSNPEKYIFIDVRSEFEYGNAHASSSVNLPIHYFYDDTHGIKNEKGVPVPKNTDQEIYLICTGGRLAGVAYGYLEHYGYRNIKRIEGGIKNWDTKNLPVITKSLFNDYKEKSFDSNAAPLDKDYVQLKK